MSLPQTDLVAPLSGHSISLAFAVLLAVHVVAGLTCVVAGAVAMRSPKRPGRHPRFGDIYYWSLSVVFVTATGMAAMRWEHDSYLFVLGSVSFGLASMGLTARRIHWQGWRVVHVPGMSLSYVALLTAFYVDNGPHLPLYDRLPGIVFWVGPTLVALPLLVRALARHTRPAADLRSSLRALTGAMAGGVASGRSRLHRMD